MENKEKELKDEQVKKEEVQTPKRDYEKEIVSLNEQISTLNAKVISLEIENQSNIKSFQEKALTFQNKAQEELNKFKSSLSEKLEEDKKELKKYGNQKMLEAIIEPLLNIELAIKAGSNQEGAVSAYVTGFGMLLNQLNAELESFGVTRIVPTVGEVFNPEIHWAISTRESEDKNKILEIKKAGYKLHDRVIKPATVVISN